jgi:beta-aspartyl-peptidase (threonine type)
MNPSFLGICALLIALAATGCHSGDPSAQITRVLDAQAACWNAGDIDGFMAGYWRSDALTFSSGGQTTRGWDATRRRYHERYADRAAMGRLRFSELEIHPLDRNAALVLGRWRLHREVGDVGGNFSLVLRRLPEGWRIVHDHTSADASITSDEPRSQPAES